LDSTGSGQGPVAGCCECGDEPSGSCATELVLMNPLNMTRFIYMGMKITNERQIHEIHEYSSPRFTLKT
jgi:hypothetical protein